MNENKAEYRRFIQDRTDIPVFFQDWWLDIVSGKNDWDVVFVKDKGGQIQLLMPFIKSKRFGFYKITQPVLTSFLGVKIFYPDLSLKQSSRYSYEARALKKWSEALDKKQCLYFNQFFSPSFSSLLPLYWNDFSVTTYYRSIIKGIQNLEITFGNFKDNRKYDIQKFVRSGNSIEETTDSGLMYDLINYSFESRVTKVPYSKILYTQIDQQLVKYGHRRIWLAKNKNGKILAGVYIIIDYDRAYLLSTGKMKGIKDSTATAALIWHAIQYASQYVDTFDFCGSMIPSISKFFQGFGGALESYPKISKHLYRWTKAIFELIKN